jgi:hypothetical protein
MMTSVPQNNPNKRQVALQAARTLKRGYSDGTFEWPDVPVWTYVLVFGGALIACIYVGFRFCQKYSTTASTMQQETAGGAGVQTGNAKDDMNNQQETSSVQPSAVPVYAFEAAPTTGPTAFCANCGTANSKSAFCTVCGGIPN